MLEADCCFVIEQCKNEDNAATMTEMATDDLHHQQQLQHSVRLPAAAAAALSGTVQFNSGQPVIINLGSADDMPGSNTGLPSSGNAAPASPAAVPASLPSMRSLLMSCEGSLPFILIVLAKLLYDHRLGTCRWLMLFAIGDE